MTSIIHCSIAILCGGSSSRFGNDKCFQAVNGKELFKIIYERVTDLSNDIFIQGCPNGIETKVLSSGTGIPVREDVFRKTCALTGIYSALLNARNPYVFMIGCDMPNIDGDLFRILRSKLPRDLVVPRWRNGFLEPLSAIYSKDLCERIRASIINDKLRITSLFTDDLNIEYVDIDSLIEEKKISRNSFLNMNRPEDLADLGEEP